MIIFLSDLDLRMISKPDVAMHREREHSRREVIQLEADALQEDAVCAVHCAVCASAWSLRGDEKKFWEGEECVLRVLIVCVCSCKYMYVHVYILYVCMGMCLCLCTCARTCASTYF